MNDRKAMTLQDTECQRRAIRDLARHQNNVIDWCVSIVRANARQVAGLTEDQVDRLAELLQSEKSTNV